MEVSLVTGDCSNVGITYTLSDSTTVHAATWPRCEDVRQLVSGPGLVSHTHLFRQISRSIQPASTEEDSKVHKPN